MAAMFDDGNNLNHFHKNILLFPKDSNFIVLSLNTAAVETTSGQLNRLKAPVPRLFADGTRNK